MSEIQLIVSFITRFCIIINATRLGWFVEINNNEIILTKATNKLTRVDENTVELLAALLDDEYDDLMY